MTLKFHGSLNQFSLFLYEDILHNRSDDGDGSLAVFPSESGELPIGNRHWDLDWSFLKATGGNAVCNSMCVCAKMASPKLRRSGGGWAPNSFDGPHFGPPQRDVRCGNVALPRIPVEEIQVQSILGGIAASCIDTVIPGILKNVSLMTLKFSHKNGH